MSAFAVWELWNSSEGMAKVEGSRAQIIAASLLAHFRPLTEGDGVARMEGSRAEMASASLLAHFRPFTKAKI